MFAFSTTDFSASAIFILSLHSHTYTNIRIHTHVCTCICKYTYTYIKTYIFFFRAKLNFRIFFFGLPYSITYVVSLRNRTPLCCFILIFLFFIVTAFLPIIAAHSQPGIRRNVPLKAIIVILLQKK